jgi:phosphatidylserine decarboxylase
MINILFPKLHKEGYRFVAIAAIITFLLLLISNFIGILCFIVTIWIYYFFRDTEKFPINDENYLVSPADGVISQIVKTKGPRDLGLEEKEFTRVSIFMNVFNCHVNRLPASGKITKIIYKPGKYINASFDKASEENERNYVKMISSSKDELVITQIAGLIARRIVWDIKEEQQVKQGERFGIIRFGSRVDLFFSDYEILVRKDQKTIGGETLIAKKK